MVKEEEQIENEYQNQGLLDEGEVLVQDEKEEGQAGQADLDDEEFANSLNSPGKTGNSWSRPGRD